MPPKKVEVELGGKKFKIKKGALHRMLKVPESYKFRIGKLREINRTKLGGKFTFEGKEFTMTNLMRDRVTLAINLMKRN